MKKINHWIIGTYLAKTSNVFERAKIELLCNFILFYLLNLLLFYGNLLANHYYYHAAIITLAIIMLVWALAVLKLRRNYILAAQVLFAQQCITGILSFIIQESKMDFVGEFWMLVNILVSFFTLGKTFGFVTTALWFLQMLHCLANDLSGGRFVLIHMPPSQVLPPAPFFVLVPFFLCVYVIYQFVKTRSIAEHDIQEQKTQIEHKNKEITDSIRYARRIQRALITSEKYIAKNIDRLQGK